MNSLSYFQGFVFFICVGYIVWINYTVVTPSNLYKGVYLGLVMGSQLALFLQYITLENLISFIFGGILGFFAGVIAGLIKEKFYLEGE